MPTLRDRIKSLSPADQDSAVARVLTTAKGTDLYDAFILCLEPTQLEAYTKLQAPESPNRAFWAGALFATNQMLATVGQKTQPANSSLLSPQPLDPPELTIPGETFIDKLDQAY